MKINGTGLRLSLLLLFAASCARGRGPGPRVIILGFDGMDFALTQELMSKGKLPNMSRVAAAGAFSSLATSIPPQSPVAWSTFMTGLDPGGHGIFDFIHREAATMQPFLSTSVTEPPSKFVGVGRWQFPLSSGRVRLLRDGDPFWQKLEAGGIETTIVRMPANFPPSGTASRELSGMGTPDVLGTYGEFSFFTSDPSAPVGEPVSGGVVRPVALENGGVSGVLTGPDQPYLKEPRKMEVAFRILPDSTRQFARIEIGGDIRLLRVGEWSDWVPIGFAVEPWMTLPAECRFYLKSLTPFIAVYVSPINLDPESPAVPISTPGRYAAELARATGRFYTQGMPEETKALKAGVLSTDEFLDQARFAQAENVRQFRYVLDRVDRGVLFYYFGGLDQVSHMLWRARDPGHPAYDARVDAKYASTIDDLYVEFDAIVGDTLRRLRPDDLLVVMSDHGFASWRRSFNLNTWLEANGWLATIPGKAGAGLAETDWPRSQAYGLGLNGLYVNLKGRERNGAVDPTDRNALLDALSSRLLAAIDPDTNQSIVAHVYRADRDYSRGRHAAIAPDLIIGYAKGTRVSDESALGERSHEILVNNTSAWSGDHCMDPVAVPGILLTTRRLRTPAASLQTLAGAILAEVK